MTFHVHSFAGARSDIFPRIALEIHFGRASARGASAGGAVICSGKGYAEAFFLGGGNGIGRRQNAASGKRCGKSCGKVGGGKGGAGVGHFDFLQTVETLPIDRRHRFNGRSGADMEINLAELFITWL
jgi:hypothetical protein